MATKIIAINSEGRREIAKEKIAKPRSNSYSLAKPRALARVYAIFSMSIPAFRTKEVVPSQHVHATYNKCDS